MSNFTQPLCDECWVRLKGDQRPNRIINTEREICCFCGQPTDSGIYIRVNPKTVAYPRKEP